MYSVTFLVLRSPPAPPSEPPSPPSEPPSPPTPPEPPDPPDPQIRPSSGEIYAQVLLLPHFTGLPRVHSEHKLPSPPPSRHVPPIITVFVPRRSSRRCCHMPITTRSPKVKLRFSLVGPYHCCGLVTSLSRPNYRSCCGPTPLFDWTRYVISNLLLSPLIRLLRYIIWNGRGHYSSFVSTPLHWLRDYQFRVQAPSIVPTAFFPSVHPLVVVICYLTFAVNSWDWLGFVQPCVSSSDMYVAFPCAPNVVGTSWAGFVISGMCTRILSGSLFNGQSRPSWALSIYMTSEGLGFTEENICVIKSQLFQPPSQKIEAFLSFSDAEWLQSMVCCGLGWSFKDPLNGKIHHGSFSRPFVSSVLVAEALALKAAIKAAIKAALLLGVSRLACVSDCQELVLLPNTDGHANELDSILADCDLFVLYFCLCMFILFQGLKTVELTL
ncbi:predicted protein [Arabidopsis lyrata subsp. lyrata]|uniref:Predicted protein n=1 Tax=Arabidopsis lyrata subsp. lyrata TaxID=81972 RepID=D7M6J3_ARALL|nr:predicted protein [Arabidopsis lyrata subsp. lyrata]